MCCKWMLLGLHSTLHFQLKQKEFTAHFCAEQFEKPGDGGWNLLLLAILAQGPTCQVHFLRHAGLRAPWLGPQTFQVWVACGLPIVLWCFGRTLSLVHRRGGGPEGRLQIACGITINFKPPSKQQSWPMATRSHLSKRRSWGWCTVWRSGNNTWTWV